MEQQRKKFTNYTQKQQHSANMKNFHCLDWKTSFQKFILYGTNFISAFSINLHFLFHLNLNKPALSMSANVYDYICLHWKQWYPKKLIFF